MTIQSEIEKLRKPIDNIKDLHLAGQIGIMLEQFSTDELYQYVRDNLHCNTYLRSWLEDQIVAAEINLRNYKK
jgi:hypothetical protein|uniref:hypothetical protein n=1 Tax=Eubacterium sp. TaxID=142586 RepID=UPI003FEDD0C2